MKVAVVIFHKTVNRYPENWIKSCMDSIRNQTFKNFDVFEVDYGFGNNQIYEGSNFENINFLDHSYALNYLLNKVFSLGYDCAFNVNVDDFYSLDRFEKQLPYIEQGYDIISSNFNIIDENDNTIKSMDMASLDIQKEANMNHNIIAHPAVCYSKNFKGQLISSEIPRDDFELWKRCYSENQYKFIILPDYLLYYRVHSQKTS